MDPTQSLNNKRRIEEDRDDEIIFNLEVGSDGISASPRRSHRKRRFAGSPDNSEKSESLDEFVHDDQKIIFNKADSERLRHLFSETMKKKRTYDKDLFVNSLIERPDYLECRDKKRRTLLYHAASIGNLPLCKLLVEEFGANIESLADNRASPLWTAAKGGWLDVVKYLLGKGAHLDNYANEDGRTIYVIQIAKDLGRAEVHRYLKGIFRRDDNINHDIDHMNINHSSPPLINPAPPAVDEDLNIIEAPVRTLESVEQELREMKRKYRESRLQCRHKDDELSQLRLIDGRYKELQDTNRRLENELNRMGGKNIDGLTVIELLDIKKHQQIAIDIVDQKINQKCTSIQEHLCSVCMEQPRSCLLLPCSHRRFCINCVQKLKANKNECPVCFTQITDVIDNVFE